MSEDRTWTQNPATLHIHPSNYFPIAKFRLRIPERLIDSNCENGCKSLKSKARATLAQLVERLIRNQQVAGSIPAGGSIQTPCFQLVPA